MLSFIIPFVSKKLNYYPSSYTVSRKEYYERAIFPQNVNAFFGWENSIPAKLQIRFKDLCWGISETQIIQIYGPPRYSIKVIIADYVYKIIFYREVLGNTNYLVQIHLLNNRFFYSCNTLRSEKNRNLRDISKKNIINKYTNGETDAAISSIILCDEENNKIVITDNVYFHVGYFSGSSESMGTLSDFNKLLDTNGAIIDNKEVKIICG